jgi:hypothetical protein
LFSKSLTNISIQLCSAYPLASLGYANWILRHYGYKTVFIFGLVLYGIGALCMWPAGLNQSFGGFCGATFVIGSGLGSLETAANPYLTGMRQSTVYCIPFPALYSFPHPRPAPIYTIKPKKIFSPANPQTQANTIPPSLRPAPLLRNPHKLRPGLQRNRHCRRTRPRLIRILHRNSRRRLSPTTRTMGLPSNRNIRLLPRIRILYFEYSRSHG